MIYSRDDFFPKKEPRPTVQVWGKTLMSNGIWRASVDCPFCGQVHKHMLGRNGRTLGERQSPCRSANDTHTAYILSDGRTVNARGS